MLWRGDYARKRARSGDCMPEPHAPMEGQRGTGGRSAGFSAGVGFTSPALH